MPPPWRVYVMDLDNERPEIETAPENRRYAPLVAVLDLEAAWDPGDCLRFEYTGVLGADSHLDQ